MSTSTNRSSDGETDAPPQPDEAGAPQRRRNPYYELTKPGIAGFVAIAAGSAYYVAAGGDPELARAIHTLIGTGVATGGALALNQYVERDVDARMKRTMGRPLPSGRLSPGRALGFGLFLSVAGVIYLTTLVGWLPAVITIASAAAYIGAYTPLKSRTYLATLVGAFPGAFPALIGWSAATGGLEIGGWVLFGIYFLWQLPHVLALAWILREDYEAVGFFLAPKTDPEGRRLGRHMVYHSTSLLALSLVPTYIGLTGVIYLAGAAVLSLAMLAVSGVAARQMSPDNVRRVFLTSILYQPLLLMLMVIDTLPR